MKHLTKTKATRSQTSLTLKAAPPLESPSNFVKMAPVIPISMLNVVTRAVNSKKWEDEYMLIVVVIVVATLLN